MKLNVTHQVFADVIVDTETGQVTLVIDPQDVDTEFGLWDDVNEDADGNPFDALENGDVLDKADLCIERARKAGTIVLQVSAR